MEWNSTNTAKVLAYCSACGRRTPHTVTGGRLGRCENAHGATAVQKKPNEQQGRLFMKHGTGGSHDG